MKPEELKCLQELNYNEEKFIIINPDVVAQALKIPSHTSCMVLLDDEDSMKYFGNTGYAIALLKWATSSGILAYKETSEDAKVNPLPLLTPQQAFEGAEQPKQDPAMDLPPTPSKVPEMAPKGPNDSPPPPPSETKVPERPAEDPLIMFDKDGNPREEELVRILRLLTTFDNRKEFLQQRRFELSSDGEFYEHKINRAIIGIKPLEELNKGWDFYEYYKAQYDAASLEYSNRIEKQRLEAQAKADAYAKEAKEKEEKAAKELAKVPEEIKEVAKASDNVIIATVPKAEIEKENIPEEASTKVVTEKGSKKEPSLDDFEKKAADRAIGVKTEEFPDEVIKEGLKGWSQDARPEIGDGFIPGIRTIDSVLRDKFAIQAMKLLINGKRTPETVATTAYKIADEMIKARKTES